MNQEKTKHRVLITGHTRGIGKAIHDRLTQDGYFCEGVSISTGHDVTKHEDAIVEEIKGFDHVVLNAYAGKSQLTMLQKIVNRYTDHLKKVVVITSTSGTPEGADDSIQDEEYTQYKRNKKELIEYIGTTQQHLVDKRLSIFDVCPDTVRTDMTKGLWEEWPKLEAAQVADAVSLIFLTQSYNINKIVIQKNVY
jgi:NAD(P)-dependent dehydrogenase (short-subunit alcohol dehydrogenase family)